MPVSCALPVSFPSVDSSYGLVSERLEAYADQWDRIMCNIFVRNVVQNGYILEFAQGNDPLLSRVPMYIAFGSARVGAGHKLLSNTISKLLGKGGDRTCRV